MAGAGYKQWVDGDILTAGDVNTYLMDQASMVFADAAARTSAIAAPSEGMISYLSDTNSIEFYNGSAWQRTYLPYATYDDSTNVASVTINLPNLGHGGRISISNFEPAVTNAIFLLRCSTDGGSTFDSTGVYNWTGLTKRGAAGAITAIGAASDTSIRISSEQTSTGADKGNLELRYSNIGAFKGTVTTMSMHSPTDPEPDLTIISFYYPTTLVNAIQLLFSTGDIDNLTFTAWEESTT